MHGENISTLLRKECQPTAILLGLEFLAPRTPNLCQWWMYQQRWLDFVGGGVWPQTWAVLEKSSSEDSAVLIVPSYLWRENLATLHSLCPNWAATQSKPIKDAYNDSHFWKIWLYLIGEEKSVRTGV